MDIGCDCSFDFDNTNSIDMDKNMLPIGTLLNGGRYKVVKHLSSGGFGKTYVVEKVFHRGELYAMKEFFIKGVNARRGNTVIVSNDENEDTFESQKSKFLTEAERLRDIENEHIVRVHDFFSDNETCYYIMDLIDGESLDAVKKPLKEEKVWDILNQVLDALSTIHQKKTIDNKKERIWLHLDIKPANLMIDKGGKVTLIDFGASKQLSANNNDLSLSMSQMSFTRGYAPIEQTSQNFDSIGPWTDFYALGATLYKLLTEKDSVIPEYSELAEILYSNDDIIKAFKFPKNISEKMRNLITWLMNPNRKKRPQSVEEISGYLNDSNEEWVEKEPEEEGEMTVIENLKSKKKKVPLIERFFNILKNKGSYIRNIRKKKIVRFIIILLIIVTSALCFIYYYIPYYNRLQFEYGERKKVLHDIEKVDSIVNYYHRFLLPVYENKTRVLYSKLGVVSREMISDSLVVVCFADKSFYNNYNPIEWSWHYWHDDLPNQPIIAGWHGYCKGKKRFYTTKDTLDFIKNNSNMKGERPDIDMHRIYKEFRNAESAKDSVACLFNKEYVKPFDKIDEYCGGRYVGPFTNGKLGGKKSMFFLENGDVFVGEFKDNHFYRGEYLYRYGVDNGDDNSYYFVGTFIDNMPYRGRWYNRFGKRLH